MSVRVEPVTAPVWLGEGPHWSHRHGALFFVSIFDKSIHKYDPATHRHTSAKLGEWTNLWHAAQISVRVEPVTAPVWLGEGPHWSHRHGALFFVSIFDKSIHKYDPATHRHTSAKLGEWTNLWHAAQMSVRVEPVTAPVWLGEGPHWSHRHGALFFVSIFDKSIHKYDPATHRHTSAKLADMPGFIIPLEGTLDRFVVGLKLDVVVVAWDGEGEARVERTVARLDAHCPENRINDAKADPKGRLFVGTMGYEYEPGKFHLKKGSLYRLDHDGSLHRVVSGVDISNGLCWSVDDAAFYYADSFEYAVRRYDYDVDTGDISNPRIVFKYKEHGLEGIADGMTIDTDGNLWIANFDGSQVLKVDPRTGKLLQKVATPALQTTSCTWGGETLDTLYVTSAAMNRGCDQPPPAGATFRVTGLGCRGHPNNCVRLELKD